MEQEDAGNGVGDVGSADIQLIQKNHLSLADSCLTTDQTQLHLRPACQTHPVSKVSVQTSLPHRSLLKVNYAQNEHKELKVTNPERISEPKKQAVHSEN